jgi:hypothetical protein
MLCINTEKGLTLVLFSDEAWFHLSRNNKSPNNKFNTLMHQLPLHDVMVGVQCAVAVTRIVGSIVFLR